MQKEKICQSLSRRYVSYILITCEAPDEEGTLNVEMNYEGDEAMVSYLLRDALQEVDKNVMEGLPAI